MPNIAYFCAMVLRTQCTGHCSGLYGKYGIPVRGGGWHWFGNFFWGGGGVMDEKTFAGGNLQ